MPFSEDVDGAPSKWLIIPAAFSNLSSLSESKREHQSKIRVYASMCLFGNIALFDL